MKPNKHRVKGRIDHGQVNISGVPTKDLVKELSSRGAVTELVVKPHEDYEIHRENGSTIETGPAIILVVED